MKEFKPHSVPIHLVLLESTEIQLTRLSDKHYKAKSISLTTCTGKLPDWLFEAKSMDIITGDRAIFTGGVLKIRDIPVLYVPAGYLPMDQKYLLYFFY